MPVLPVGARRMWLRRFGKATRRTEWAATQPSIQAARLSATVASQQFEDLDIPQVAEILVVEANALGADVTPNTLVRHDGTLLELVSGPHAMPSDRSWEYFTINARKVT